MSYSADERSLIQRFIENTDWILVAAVSFVVIMGLTGVLSATLHYGNSGKYIATQSAAIVIGLIGLVALLSINYQYYRSFLWYVYGVSIFILILVLVFGSKVRGTTGWFNFGVFSFQPVEMAKLIFIVVLAGYLDRAARDIRGLKPFFVSLLLLGSHWFLIMLQPDFSSTLAYIPAALIMLYIAGVPAGYIGSLVLYGSIAVGISLAATFFKLQPVLVKNYEVVRFFLAASNGGWQALAVLSGAVTGIFFLWWILSRFKVNIPLILPILISLIVVAGGVSSFAVQKGLKEYQRKRLIVFINPEIDPLGSGYNIIQSKIAIGSGGLTGRGLFSGKQTQLGFLPEQHTDFVFSVIGEETGYFVSQLLLIVYFIIIWRAMIIARDARDRFGSYIATGIATMFAFYALINIGMTMGLMPVTGMPLPLLSYGGSSMAASLWAIGILLSIHIRRFTN